MCHLTRKSWSFDVLFCADGGGCGSSKRGLYSEQALFPVADGYAIEQLKVEHPPSEAATDPSHAGQHLSPNPQRSWVALHV